MAIDIKSFLAQLQDGIVDLAKSNFKKLSKQATADGKQLLATLKDDLGRWTRLLAEGQITKKEFETLLIGQKDLIEMNALKQAGLTLVKIDEFKSGIFDLIIDSVTKLV